VSSSDVRVIRTQSSLRKTSSSKKETSPPRRPRELRARARSGLVSRTGWSRFERRGGPWFRRRRAGGFPLCDARHMVAREKCRLGGASGATRRSVSSAAGEEERKRRLERRRGSDDARRVPSFSLGALRVSFARDEVARSRFRALTPRPRWRRGSSPSSRGSRRARPR
jgi:hypothetical protein